jgi:hypothetical protein
MGTATASTGRPRVRAGVGAKQRGAKTVPGRPLRPAGSGASRSEPPAIVSVFFHTDGTICHSWCGRPLEFHGSRGGLELDFFCTRCVEHVTLPQSVLSRIPVGPGM